MTVFDESHLTEEQKHLLRLERIFMPYAARQRLEAYERQKLTLASPSGLRFAHYTSAEAAIEILRSKRIWMRNTTCMADYREVLHGFDMLRSWFDRERTQKFTDTLDQAVPGVARKVIEDFNAWWLQGLPQNIFVASLSEHDQTEDTHGRLSMWRAFGASSTRLAIVISVPHQSGIARELGIVFGPVAYLQEHQVHAVIEEIIENCKREAEFLKTSGAETIRAMLFMMLFAGATSLKHEGFHEEREWRAIYSPQLFPSKLMEKTLKTVAGVPQHIFLLPMDERVSAALHEIDLTHALDRVIIGPTQYPWVLRDALIEVLTEIGIPSPSERVQLSQIPIRP